MASNVTALLSGVVTMVDACAAPQGGSTCFDPVRGVGRREKNKFT